MSNAFDAPHFQSHDEARKWLEAQRWPNGPVCSHCGTIGRAYAIKKAGWYRCAEKGCRKDFSVTTGTVMERSHIPLNKWMIAFYLMNASKKGVSAHQLHRSLGLDYKSAWFMGHRIREAMRDGGLTPMGGSGKIVEADETYFGKTEEPRIPASRKGRPYKVGSRGPRDKRPILALVERGGRVRTFHVAVADQSTVNGIVASNIAAESRLHTDESGLYALAPYYFQKHETVKHSVKEYARWTGAFVDGKPDVVHTNSAEGYFGLFKRGMKGIYQHCREKHLHRYLAEYDHRYNFRVALGYSDIDRTIAAIKGIEGKRLTYRQPH
jgi:transposase-like protein